MDLITPNTPPSAKAGTRLRVFESRCREFIRRGIPYLPLVLAAVLLAALAWPLLLFWKQEFTQPDSYYAHAPIIPLMVALMFWHRREALRAAPKAPSLWGVIALVPLLVGFVIAVKTEMQAVQSQLFLLILVASVWLTLGARFVRAAAFPFAFLWLMPPLPGPVLNDATVRFQMISTILADNLLHLMTLSTYLQGNVITLDHFTLFVDVACSGFKLLLALLTFSAAFAYLADGTPVKRGLLFLFSLPLSLLINGIRIALIGVVGEVFGGPAANVFHDWSGAITIALGFVALFTLAKGFRCRTLAGWAIF